MYWHFFPLSCTGSIKITPSERQKNSSQHITQPFNTCQTNQVHLSGSSAKKKTKQPKIFQAVSVTTHQLDPQSHSDPQSLSWPCRLPPETQDGGSQRTLVICSSTLLYSFTSSANVTVIVPALYLSQPLSKLVLLSQILQLLLLQLLVRNSQTCREKLSWRQHV